MPPPSPHLYVFESDPDMGMLLEEMLTSEGYRVTRSPDAEFSPAAVARDSPALALVDLRLGSGGDHGLQVIRRLRAAMKPVRLPAILLTGDHQWIRRRAGTLGDLSDFAVLPKPFDIDALVELVDAMRRLVNGPTHDGLLDTAVGVLITDAQTRYLAANRGALDLLGYTLDELTQMHVADVMTTAPGETAQEWDRYVRDQSWARPATLRCKDGSGVRVRIHASMIHAPDGVLYVAWMRPEAS